MLWVGTYAAKGGKGLCPLERQGAVWSAGPGQPQIANASYGLWSSATRTAYFVDEQEHGRVTAWRRSGEGWEARGSQPTGGALPCYLALHPGKGLLAVANYGDGSVALIGIDRESGDIGALTDVFRAAGKGVDPERQDGPHAHCVVFDEPGGQLFHVDLGLDRVFRHRVEDNRLRGTEAAFEAPPGSGPRHLVLHPDRRHALLLTELSGELILLERTETGFRAADAVQTSPAAHAGNLGGHLAVDSDGGLFVTNRGHDSLVAFTIRDGRLERRGWVRTGSASPRHFHEHDGEMIVAHEEGGTVSVVPRPGAGTNGAASRQTIAVPGAAFVLETPDQPEEAAHDRQ